MSDTLPTFSLVYTSARAATIPKVVEFWHSRAASQSGIEWCIAVDDGSHECRMAAETVAARYTNVKVVINTGPKNCVAGWNAGAAVATGKVLIAVADDFRPPVGWDALLLSLQPKGWEDGEHVVKVEDGYVHDIFVLPILTRKRYARFGYIFYPKYESMFCDTEFGAVAQRDGVVIDANHLLFEHMHPDCGKRQRDTVDICHASDARWSRGEMIYNFRKARNFPLDDGPMAQAEQPELSTSNDNERYVAYLQVTKDDLCLLAVCERLVSEGVRDFFFSLPDTYWSGDHIPVSDRLEVTAVIDTLKAAGHTVHSKVFNVDSYTMPGDSRILVETRVRNSSLAHIRQLGYKHILVVDGDELWVPGTLEIVKGYVEQGRDAISVHMVPVIGFPGYPVDGAMDVAVVYVGLNVNFKVCRSPYVPQAIIQRQLIYHFTGTRRTLEETISKHRQSGHYDDPDYDFEGWIQNVLPNIRPGLLNAHMYKPRQIWPRVRAWRADEWAQMPESVVPYLGRETEAHP